MIDRQMQSQKTERADIAIVGIGCWYPGAHGPRELWENILACRRQFRQIPAERLGHAYFSPDVKTPDKTYCQRVAVIDGFKFDGSRFRIPQSTVASTDIAQWLALQVASETLEDARMMETVSCFGKTGVFVGNTLTGDQTRSSSMRLRWPYVRKSLEIAGRKRGLSRSDLDLLAKEMEDVYKSAFAPVNEDTLAGGLSNTIAGRICNHFDFHGGGYTVDGACASSLLAVCSAAEALSLGRLDVALAGGVDISLDTFELIGFAKIGALARDEMRVYESRGNGFQPGEGCGFVVLKRVEDARKAADHIYALIRGWGISSDGRGAITAPTVKGQSLALERAYRQAGYALGTIDFIEGHGTGTPVGDRVEIEAISSVAGGAETIDERRVGLTSIKSLIGHTKAAAGIAGLIKATMAVNRRVLPPFSGCEQPHPSFKESTRAVYPLRQGKLLPVMSRLRAGVSAMGFGGINTHLTLESADPPLHHLSPSLEERSLLASYQTAEAFVFAADSWSSLAGQVEQLSRTAGHLSDGELIDLAFSLACKLPREASCRAVVWADRPRKLAEVLGNLAVRIRQHPLDQGLVHEDPDGSWMCGQPSGVCRVGFAFPGQGSQQLQMGYRLIERHPWAREISRRADRIRSREQVVNLEDVLFRNADRAVDQHQVEAWESELAQTNFAQPAICQTSVLYSHLLQNLGVQPAVVIGHSLGELVALHFAGGYDEETLWKLSAIRGRIMHEADTAAGGMVSLLCSQSEAEQLVAKSNGVVISNRNSPSQFVASGSHDALNRLLANAKRSGISVCRLSVRQAFHSRLMQEKAERFRGATAATVGNCHLSLPWISTVADVDTLTTFDMRDHLTRQITSPVDFISPVEQLGSHCDVVLEVGPGRVLTDLVRQTAQGRLPAFPVASRPNRDPDLIIALAACYIRGVSILWTRLFDDRLVRPFVPASERHFIDNPCERLSEISLVESGMEGVAIADEPDTLIRETSTATDTPKLHLQLSAIDFLIKLAGERTGFPASRIHPGSRFLDDLNLDSIKAAELISAATRQFGVAGSIDPANFANQTLQAVAETIDQQTNGSPHEHVARQRDPSTAVDSLLEIGQRYPTWVRNFVVDFD